MSRIDESENDKYVKELRLKSLSFRYLQLISYLGSETNMSTNMNIYGIEVRVRGNMVDALHSTIFELIEENKRLKQEIYNLEEDLSKYEH